MSRTWSVCSHEDAVRVNELLVIQGLSNRAITRQFSLSKDAVRRHREHIPELLVEASRDAELFEATAILGRVEDLERETLDALKQAKNRDELGFVLGAIREQRRNLELVSKIRQLIETPPSVNVTVISPDARRVIVQALEPYPDARQAVADALAQIEEAAS